MMKKRCETLLWQRMAPLSTYRADLASRPKSAPPPFAYTLFEAPLAPTMLWNLMPVGLSYALLQLTLRAKDDGDLAKRLKDRDPRAMSDLYDRYGRIAYSLIYRVVRNTGAAEDLVQETFLRVWNRVQSFDQTRGALGPWVLTVARNRAIDYLRSVDGKMSAGALELDRLETPVLFSDFEDRALSIDRSRILKSAFEKLTPVQKQVIELAYFEGLSQTEMAERMNQPLGTVKTWVRSALKALREDIAGEAMA
jgi:RNA polymerase sigma-70 factor (ECF subfamily)